MVKSMPESTIFCIGSPEQGAQQECSSSRSWPVGSCRGMSFSLPFLPRPRAGGWPWLVWGCWADTAVCEVDDDMAETDDGTAEADDDRTKLRRVGGAGRTDPSTGRTGLP